MARPKPSAKKQLKAITLQLPGAYRKEDRRKCHGMTGARGKRPDSPLTAKKEEIDLEAGLGENVFGAPDKKSGGGK